MCGMCRHCWQYYPRLLFLRHVQQLSIRLVSLPLQALPAFLRDVQEVEKVPHNNHFQAVHQLLHVRLAFLSLNHEDGLVSLHWVTSQLLPFHKFWGLSTEINISQHFHLYFIGAQLQFCYLSQLTLLRKQQHFVVYAERPNPIYQ